MNLLKTLTIALAITALFLGIMFLQGCNRTYNLKAAMTSNAQPEIQWDATECIETGDCTDYIKPTDLKNPLDGVPFGCYQCVILTIQAEVPKTVSASPSLDLPLTP